MNTNASLADALRKLPMVEPPVDLFAEVAATLQARRSRRHPWIPLGLAAGVALALLLVRSEWPAPATDETATTSTSARAEIAVASATTELQRLNDYSRRLETWLAATSQAAPRDGRNLMAVAELEDLIGLIDVQLSAARDADESLPLWRQRVALLEDLAAVRSQPALLSAQAAQNAAGNTIL